MANNNKTIELEVNVSGKGIKELKSELREMQTQFAAATDPEQANKFAAAAGAIRDRIKEVNEQINVMATGSGLEQVSNGLGLIKDQLLSLDFEGAADSARNLTANIKSMDPKTVAAGFKGLISTIGQLGNAFFQMGLKLLANPIFLIVAVITAVVVAIVLLKDKLKILGAAFDFIMKPIKILIQGLKDLADWLGITSFAAEENADRTIAANKKKAASSKEYVDNKIADLDREIAELKAAGKETTDLELERTRLLRADANNRILIHANTIKTINQLEKDGKAELSKDQKEAREEARQGLKEAQQDFRNGLSERNVIINEANRKQKEKRDANQKQEKDDLKRHNDEVKKLMQGLIRDIEDLQATTDRQRLQLQKEREAEIIKVTTTAGKERNDAMELLNKKYAILFDNLNKETAKSMFEHGGNIVGITTELNNQLKELRATDLESRIALEQEDLERQKNATLAEIEKLGGTEFDKERVRELYRQIGLEKEKQYQKERQKLAEETSKANQILASEEAQAYVAMFGQVGNALTAASGLAKEGTATQKTLAVAGATMATFESAVNSYNGMVEAIPGPIGIAAGVAAAAASVAMGIANVQKILAVKIPGKSSGGGGGVPGGTQTQIAPSFNFSSGTDRQGNNDNNTATSAQTVDTGRTMPVRAYVLESDVTATQGRVSRYASNSEL